MVKSRPTIADPFATPGSAAVRGTPVEDLPRPTPPPAVVGDGRPGRSGIKAATTGTTLYLLPPEAKRLKRLALDMDLTLHELVLQGVDKLLAEHGQPPLTRYGAE